MKYKPARPGVWRKQGPAPHGAGGLKFHGAGIAESKDYVPPRTGRVG